MEIERKYLVKKNLWIDIKKSTGENILQGYLSTDINKTIRVRIIDSKAFMTIKGKTINISREEFEFPVPIEQATQIIRKFSEGNVEKIRYRIPYKGKIWEVDEFSGDNTGLIIAEIELDSENEIFEIPDWVDKEVSDNIRYFNSNLIKYPYKNW